MPNTHKSIDLKNYSIFSHANYNTRDKKNKKVKKQKIKYFHFVFTDDRKTHLIIVHSLLKYMYCYMSWTLQILSLRGDVFVC